MTEKYIMSENNIPDGILHDQDLYNISLRLGSSYAFWLYYYKYDVFTMVHHIRSHVIFDYPKVLC